MTAAMLRVQGVKVAISVVIICLLILMFGLMFFLIQRRRMAAYNQAWTLHSPPPDSCNILRMQSPLWHT